MLVIPLTATDVPYVYRIPPSIKHPVTDQVKQSFVIFDIRALCPDVKNDGLTLSGTGCFVSVPIWQQFASKTFHRVFNSYLVYILVASFVWI